MPNKLKYHILKGKKVYTLKSEVKDVSTKDAHYKFVKIKSVKAE
tara:strand:- start:1147 stop:1278 length:132 start_codon:yes stop_codon:yes gene_type:complete